MHEVQKYSNTNLKHNVTGDNHAVSESYYTEYHGELDTGCSA